MAAPQSSAQILMAGGALAGTGKKSLLCQAFNDAAKDWCADHKAYKAAKKANGGKPPPGATPPGKFNDRFYEKLRGLDSTYANNVGREAPALFRAGRPVGGGLGLVSNVAARGAGGRISKRAARAARAMNTRWNNIAGAGGLTGGTALARGAADRMSGRLYRYYDKYLSKRVYPRFYDGVLPGPPPRVLEIKGPTDSFNRKGGAGQARDLARLRPKTAAVTCKSCKSPHCKTTASGGQRCT